MSKKLKDNTGASLAVALLFFIMMAVIGSVILAAAASSMGRVKDQDQGNQERYALSSAAKLIVDRISGQPVSDKEVTFTSNQVDYYINNDGTVTYDNNITPVWENQFTADNPSAGNILSISQILTDKVLENCWSDLTSKWNDGQVIYWTDYSDSLNIDSQQFTFVISPGSQWTEKASDYDVRAKITVNKDLSLKVDLSLKDANSNDNLVDKKYQVNIKLNDGTAVDPTDDQKNIPAATILFSHDPTAEYINETQTRYQYLDANNTTQWTDWGKNLPEDVQYISSETRTHIREKRTITFQNFNWEPAEDAVITAISDSSSSEATS